ncbi:Ras-related protein Rab-4 [Geodia barretti]|uniref:Ras-related protein Rab-4 n=1 Tax=Geodia barretti TaxID=519541 RepID=A0AA35TLT4_GEOBA|nr:Ras-related protein Rab-4 [Geodia barretti]
MDGAEKVRVLVCGDGGVGKNRLIKKFISVGGIKASTLSTIGVDVQSKTIRVGDKDVKLQIWTTAGQERFRSMPAKYYGRADGIVLVYDVTQRKTFDNVKHWLTDITENTLNRDVRIALVGNKIDLLTTPESSDTHSRALASSNGILFFETSAETGENLEELFLALATEILDKVSLWTCKYLSTRHLHM